MSHSEAKLCRLNQIEQTENTYKGKDEIVITAFKYKLEPDYAGHNTDESNNLDKIRPGRPKQI